MSDEKQKSFEIDTAARSLSVDGVGVQLGARAFDVLAYLDRHSDRVVSKQELLDDVWGQLSVEEGNLTVQISTLRKVLGSSAISTVPGVGYKLTPEAADRTPTPVLELPEKPSLAVLPFANLTGRDDNDYLVDGIVADLVSAISRIPGIFVIATSSSFLYKGKPITLAEVGAELGVRYVLEGSVQMGGNRLRITAQLVQAANGHTVWTERFEGSVEDVFDLQDRIAEQTASALELKITLAEAERTRSKPTGSVQAYDFALQAAAMAFRVSTKEELDRTLEVVDKALALDPDYAFAKALKLRAYMMAAASRAISYDEGQPAIALARELLDGPQPDPFALVHGGHVVAFLALEPELGYRALMQALAMNPNSILVLVSCAWIAAYLGRYEEAIGYFERNLRLNPLHPNTAHARAAQGYALMGQERFAESVEAFESALSEDPGFGSTASGLTVAYELAGRHEDAVALFKKSAVKAPWYTIASFRKHSPFTEPNLRANYENSLRQVGVPEG